MRPPPVLIALNYHRIAEPDPADPARRLHTVAPSVFAQQVRVVRRLGPLVSLADAREGLTEPLNFTFTFDDVRTSSTVGMGILRGFDAPYGLFASARLTSEGFGLRDKVYLLLATRSEGYLMAAARDWLGSSVPDEGLDFYQLTKSTQVPAQQLESDLIDPLVAEVLAEGEHHLNRRHLTWAALRAIISDPLATVGNHGAEHANMELLTPAEIRDDIRTSHAEITEQVGTEPKWFAVPFGRVGQPLALDVTDALVEMGYYGCLWVGTNGTIAATRRRCQLAHVIRLHAPTDIGALEQAVARARDHAVTSIAQTIAPQNHRGSVTFRAGDGLAPLIPIETLVRSGKDYATDPDFYRYLFADNPSKGGQADHESVLDEYGRVEAVAYAFHTTFVLGGVRVVGSLLSGWRRLPRAHSIASARLVRRIIERSAIVGVYHPNALASRAFGRWRSVEVSRHTVPLDRYRTGSRTTRSSMSSEFNDEMERLFASVPHDADFTVVRDAPFYRWRYGQYPLASTTFIVEAGRWRAVVLEAGDRVSISDYAYVDAESFKDMWEAVASYLATAPHRSVVIETSCRDTSRQLRDLGSSARTFQNYYHFDTARLHAAGAPADILDRWDELRFTESEASGDVLLR